MDHALPPSLYQSLRDLALRRMGAERANHTLQPTALVHEAWLRLSSEEAHAFRSRDHLLCTAARTMRHILIDHARCRDAAKRGSGGEKLPVDEEILPPTGVQSGSESYLVALDEALDRLAGLGEPHERVVELRFFGGLSVPETAEALGISTRTVERSWRFARAWLMDEIAGVED